MKDSAEFSLEKANDIKFLLKIVQETQDVFPLTESGRAFVQKTHIGRIERTKLIFSPEDRQRITRILTENGIPCDLDRTLLTMAGSRHDTLRYSPNEKMSGTPIKAHTILVRPLHPDGFLRRAGGRYPLASPRSPILMNFREISDLFEFRSVVVVENLECFLFFDQINGIDFSVADPESLVVFRGEKSPEISTGSVYEFLRSLHACPVFAFVDYDPAGMVIASGLPGFSKLIMPHDEHHLETLMRKSGRASLFNEQQRQLKTLSALKNPAFKKIQDLLLHIGKGLPQEIFIKRTPQ